jgi:predicted Rossmann fold nucleotide-binding protein DprA/Smf involved in DNA uptake
VPKVQAARRRTAGENAVWSITHRDGAYPPQLVDRSRAGEWPVLYGLGNREILRCQCLGLICSVQCPGSVVIKTLDAIRELRDAGVVVAGGFHSPMEQECLDFLLRGDQPVIICPARHPSTNRLPPSWREALDADRLLIVSPFGSEIKRPTQFHAQTRNEFVAALSAAVLIPHASSGGKAEAVARQILQRGQPLVTLDDDENNSLVGVGAERYCIVFIQSSLGLDRRE